MAKKNEPKKADPVVVKWGIDTGIVCASHHGEWEFDREEWDRMTPAQRVKACDDSIQEEISNYIDGWYEISED